MSTAAATTTSAQPQSDTAAGRAALDAHDPTAAVAAFSKVESAAAREWLAVALMMESRSPTDAFVERAYQAAREARAFGTLLPSRTDTVAALQTGDLVVTFLVGETHAYAWAFDRDGFAGYRLPDPPKIVEAVDRAVEYAARQDDAGMKRIADDLMPELFGPAMSRLPTVKRLILLPDGPLRRLPFDKLAAEQVDEVVTADHQSLGDAIARPQSAPVKSTSVTTVTTVAVVVFVMVLAAVMLKRRSARVVRR